MPWKIKCNECGTIAMLNVSFDISKQKTIYYYCKVCKKNTFNDILGYLELDEEPNSV
ncbi:MAG: hypothetical protein QXR57_04760 [Metallosphaera sp.]|uniref:Uncharacterized protein n=1 Tax=Metallosphaera cuprina (strain Ar-4) TaxID=1006006 RepID=F4G081_METCR|nr:hypothetical protein [Metallosphaera cuprina]AEB94580.1 conserved hypothetical protein [Metallosphaera cuprina Ar-4]